MSILCKMFGHARPRSGWWGDGLYGEVSGGHSDGIGRTYFVVRHECPRCGEKYVAARFHGASVVERLVRSDPLTSTIFNMGRQVGYAEGLKEGVENAKHAIRLVGSADEIVEKLEECVKR